MKTVSMNLVRRLLLKSGRNSLAKAKNLGVVEVNEYELNLVSTPDFIVAGSPTNACFLMDFAVMRRDFYSKEEAIQALVDDLGAGEHPSGNLITD